MNDKDYITKELELMKHECERDHLCPEEWVRRNAVKYHELHSKLEQEEKST
ncbi:MAG: hypothetical protein HYS07_05825 [Chlamydiae bacterium]|nr:hypothetical protein [Chlamydiota bacterium]MBI3277888.1 hypothetical protein [Chlamydiota bacterium]